MNNEQINKKIYTLGSKNANYIHTYTSIQMRGFRFLISFNKILWTWFKIIKITSWIRSFGFGKVRFTRTKKVVTDSKKKYSESRFGMYRRAWAENVTNDVSRIIATFWPIHKSLQNCVTSLSRYAKNVAENVSLDVSIYVTLFCNNVSRHAEPTGFAVDEIVTGTIRQKKVVYYH